MKKGLSRRQFLRGSAAGAFSLFLAANGIRLGAQESTYNFNLPDAIGDFPTGDFTLRWIDSAGEQATFWNALICMC